MGIGLDSHVRRTTPPCTGSTGACPMNNATMKDNVSKVADAKLCCSCGACAWICPRKAVSYRETVGGYLLPEINPVRCTGCGVCLSICPGAGLASGVLNRLPKDPFTGDVLDAYVGKATDKDLYANSQSGGIVSALLSHALKTGKIAAAVTTVMVEGNPPRAVPRLAMNADEVRLSQKSKYCPVPLLSIMEEVEKVDSPVALVGVSCQIHGLLNIVERYPRLKDKIRFTVGLICERTMAYTAMDYLIKKVGSFEDGAIMLHFRDKACGGYPGNVNIVCSNGRSTSLPATVRKGIKDFFTPARCRLCFDKMNVLADITVGDPWGISPVDRAGGESIAVVRTEAGRNLFRDAIDKGAVAVRQIDYQQALAGQKIDRKRLEWNGYMEAWRPLGWPIPNFCENILRPAAPEPCSDRFRNDLLHALSLDQYASRDAVVAAASKAMLFQGMRRNASWLLGMAIRVGRRIAGNIVQGVC